MAQKRALQILQVRGRQVIRHVSVVPRRNTQARPSFSLVSLVIRLG
jgi:hypothetical protein